MKRLAIMLISASLVSACATDNKDGDISSLDDPKFVSWYKAASPYARTAFFITLCAAQGFSNGSIEINFCISNMRRNAKIRVEGRL
ncbi:MAG: hypothetical protein L7U45_05690 [Alphaproteobacteria bacterium]|nr:hypothetical protein [Alphaproteobacteria bacterium]